MRKILAIIVLIISLLIAKEANSEPIKKEVNVCTESSLFEKDFFEGGLVSAISFWNVNQKYVEFSLGEITKNCSFKDFHYDKNKIWIYFIPSEFFSKTIKNGNVYQIMAIASDDLNIILFNREHSFVELPDNFSIILTITHELGHILGLDHEDDQNSLMYFAPLKSKSVILSDESKRALEKKYGK
jgi:hypothetical protein